MKRIFIMLFLALGLMSGVQAMQQGALGVVVQGQAQPTPEELAVLLEKRLRPGLVPTINPFFLALEALVTKNGVQPRPGKAGKPYDTWNNAAIASQLSLLLQANQPADLTNGLRDLYTHEKPGMLGTVWNGVKSIGTHLSNNKWAYLGCTAFALIALAYASPTGNPWDHPLVMNYIRENSTLIAYWEQLRNHFASNSYVARVNEIAQEQGQCLTKFADLEGYTPEGTCKATYDASLAAAQNIAETYNAQKSWYQWSKLVDTNVFNTALDACRNCAAIASEKCTDAAQSSGGLMNRAVAYLFTNGCK